MTKQQTEQDVVEYDQTRLPYHKGLKTKYDVDVASWRVLTETTFPSAKTPEAIGMAIAYCKQRNLDIFKKPIHIVPVWSSALNRMVETVWPGIAELRTTASRTGQYAGCDECAFGDDKLETFQGSQKIDGKWQETKVSVTFPEWAQMTVYRMIGGHRAKFVGPKVRWLETYASVGKHNIPNDRWQRAAFGQLEKCAEAAALRRAFPEELGGEYAAEEMEGQHSLDDIGGAVIEHDERTPLQAPPPHEIHEADIDVDTIEESGSNPGGPVAEAATKIEATDGAASASTEEPEDEPPFEVDKILTDNAPKWLKGVRYQFAHAPDATTVSEIMEKNVDPHRERFLPPDIEKAEKAKDAALKRIAKSNE